MRFVSSHNLFPNHYPNTMVLDLVIQETMVHPLYYRDRDYRCFVEEILNTIDKTKKRKDSSLILLR